MASILYSYSYRSYHFGEYSHHTNIQQQNAANVSDPACTFAILKEIGLRNIGNCYSDERQTTLPFPEQSVSCPDNPFLLYLPKQILPAIYFQMHLSHMSLSVSPSTVESERRAAPRNHYMLIHASSAARL